MRPSKRAPDQLRPVTIKRQFTIYAEGSVFITVGDTQVLCTASIESGVPRFLKDTGQGWLTAEYSMLPRATHERVQREASRGRQGGRTLEIQRLIGRSLRSVVDFAALGEYTITIDCDVIQADGGTRTASITGGCVALYDALAHMVKDKALSKTPFKHWIAAVSVGMYENTPILDLDYAEDSQAETDMNVVMTESDEFIEIQGTAEKQGFRGDELMQMTELAQLGVRELIDKQRKSCMT